MKTCYVKQYIHENGEEYTSTALAPIDGIDENGNAIYGDLINVRSGLEAFCDDLENFTDTITKRDGTVIECVDKNGTPYLSSKFLIDIEGHFETTASGYEVLVVTAWKRHLSGAERAAKIRAFLAAKRGNAAKPTPAPAAKPTPAKPTPKKAKSF